MTHKPAFLEDSLIVAAHPDDELLWFTSILKDVDEGPQTILNTREFVYYSYYSRIKSKLQQFWEPKIKEKMTHIQ